MKKFETMQGIQSGIRQLNSTDANDEVTAADATLALSTPTQQSSQVNQTADAIAATMDTASEPRNAVVNNRNPHARKDWVRTDQDDAVQLDLLGNDTDRNGDTLTVLANGFSDPSNGTVSAAADGSYIYTPDAGFSGRDTFTYTVSDGDGGTDTATVRVIVDTTNRDPNARNDVRWIDQDTPVAIDLLDNDLDRDRDPLTVLADSITAPENGTFDLTDGVLTYTPDAGFHGLDLFTYTVSDGNGGTDTASIRIKVFADNRDPNARNDFARTDASSDVQIDLLINDTDRDGDSINIVPNSLTAPAHGTVSVSDDGTATYVPDGDFVGRDEFFYTVTDGNGATDTARVGVRVDPPITNPPVASDDALTTDGDTPITFDPLVNDADANADPLSVTDVQDPPNGSVTVNNDGTVVYTPDAGFAGTDSFDYTISDGTGLTSTATITITVDPVVVDELTATDDIAIVVEGGSVSIPVLINDVDTNGDPLTVISVGQPSDGTATIDANGQVQYTPDLYTFGVDSFDYTVSDGTGNISTASVTVYVEPTNDAPVVDDDTALTTEGDPVIIDVLANDYNKYAEQDLNQVDSVGAPSNGTAAINDDGTITYIPNAGFVGTDSFTYVFLGRSGQIDTATVTVTVSQADPALTINDDQVDTSPGTPVVIDVIANDQSGSGADLTLLGVSQPANGTVAIGDDGVPVYTPTGLFNGTDTFTYTVSDGSGATGTGTVTVTVIAPENEDPIAGTDAFATDFETPVDIDVLFNDTDSDGDPLTITGFDPASSGQLVLNDGIFTFTPDDDFTGDYSFTYTISDGKGGVDTATATIYVAPPISDFDTTDDAVSTPNGTPVAVDVLANDPNPDGIPLTVVDVTQPANGTASITADGTVVYTPETDFFGPDQFEYTVSDGNGVTDVASVTVTVEAPENTAPVADDDVTSVLENGMVDIAVLQGDIDPDGDPLTVISVSDPSNGTATINADGTITYTSDPFFSGQDTFTYDISDGNGLLDTATVTIATTDPIGPIILEDDFANTQADTPVTIDVLTNDFGNNMGDLTVTSVDSPINGTATLAADGTVTYTPDATFDGIDIFTYTASDGAGTTSVANVSVTVEAPENTAPIAGDDVASTIRNSTTDIFVLSDDIDPDGDPLTIIDVTDGVDGTTTINPDGTINYTPDLNFYGLDQFTYTISDGTGLTDTATAEVFVANTDESFVDPRNDVATTSSEIPVTISVLDNDLSYLGNPLTIIDVGTADGGIAELGADGTIIYTPDADTLGEDTFTYTISDGEGDARTALVTVTVEAPENAAPVAMDAVAGLLDNGMVDIAVLQGDIDPDGDPLTVISVSDPANGTATINADGTVTYTVDPFFWSSDEFTYDVSDGNGLQDTGSVTIVVGFPPVPIIVEDDFANTQADTPVTIDVLANDFAYIGYLNLTSVDSPINGTATLAADGTVTYTPDATFDGIDVFSYTVSDGAGTTSGANVSVTVEAPENTAPVAAWVDTSFDLGGTVDIAVLTGSSDIDGDPLTIVDIAQPLMGTATLNPDDTITYTPNPGFIGVDFFTYAISDGNGLLDTGTVTLNAYDTPLPQPDFASTLSDTPVIIAALDNDTEQNGDPMTIIEVGTPENGTASINPDGTILYTPAADFAGTDSFFYNVSDGNGLTAPTRITVDVSPTPNGLPVAWDDTITTDEGLPTVIPVRQNDNDPDGDPLTVIDMTSPRFGTATLNEQGEVVYTPIEFFNGTDQFDYTVSDGKGGVDTATATVTVNNVPDDVYAVDDTRATNEDTPVTFNPVANDESPNGNSLTLVSVGDPENGTATINPDGTVTFTPDPDFNGETSFLYTMSNGRGETDTATATITVDGGTNAAPQANDYAISVLENVSSIIPTRANDFDPDGDPLTVIDVTSPRFGTATLNEQGEVVYTPIEFFSGEDQFDYTVSDGKGGIDTATATVNVDYVPDDIYAVDDARVTNEDTPVTFNPVANDESPNGNSLTLVSVGDPENGTATINPDGTVTFTPDPDFNGETSFFYTISNGRGETDTATATISVDAIENEAPIAFDDVASTQSAGPVLIDVLANDIDVEDDTLIVSDLSAPDNGSVTLSPEGFVLYVPDVDFVGEDTFGYVVSDGLDSDTGQVTILVTSGAQGDTIVPILPIDTDPPIDDLELDEDGLPLAAV